MNRLILSTALLAGCLTSTLSFAVTPDTAPVSTYTFTNGSTCVGCKVVAQDWGVTFLKPSLKYYYDRLLRQAAAGGEHLTLEKPDKTLLKVATHSIKTEETTPENQTTHYNLSTFDGQRLKNVRKALTDYQASYFVFITDSDERVTVPFQAVEYLAEAESGKLLLNGVDIKAKVANYVDQQNKWVMTGMMMQRNMTNSAMLQQQKLQTQAMMMPSFKPVPVQQVSPTTINCNTYGNNTTCTGW